MTALKGHPIRRLTIPTFFERLGRTRKSAEHSSNWTGPLLAQRDARAKDHGVPTNPPPIRSCCLYLLTVIVGAKPVAAAALLSEKILHTTTTTILSLMLRFLPVHFSISLLCHRLRHRLSNFAFLWSITCNYTLSVDRNLIASRFLIELYSISECCAICPILNLRVSGAPTPTL